MNGEDLGMAISKEDKAVERVVQFMYKVDRARQVTVAGTFNQWNEHNFWLEPDPGSSGLWRGILRLKPGRYEYRFLVDGKWAENPKKLKKVPNTYGTFNCLLEVR